MTKCVISPRWPLARRVLTARTGPMGHAHKGVTIQAVAHVLELMGALAPVLQRVSPDSRIALEYPHSQRFHPGSVLDETMAAVAGTLGREFVSKVMFRAMQQSLEGIVAPLAHVFLAINGGGPMALLEKLDVLIGAGASGFDAKWTKASTTDGEAIISAPSVLPAEADETWKGLLEYLLTFARVQGQVTVLPRERGGRDCRLHVAWRS